MVTRFRLNKRTLVFVLILVVMAVVIITGAMSPDEPHLGEEYPPGASTLLNFSSEQVDWMEISPQMSSTTYVDDSDFINRVINLLTQENLRPAAQEEVTEMKTTQPDPPEVTIDGNTYNRNMVVEFIQKVDGQKTETITTVQLCGDLIRINDDYYASASATDEFIVILNDIHTQSKGKSSVEILSLPSS